MPITKSFLLLIIVISLFIAYPTGAQVDFDFEVDLPNPIPATELRELLPSYIITLYNLLIGAVGVIALAALVYGGVRYLTSAGNPVAMSDAQSQMIAGFLGTIIILGAFLIAQNINPQIVIPHLDLRPITSVKGDLPGVYLCVDGTYAGSNCSGEEFYVQGKAGYLPPQIDDHIEGIWLEEGKSTFVVDAIEDCNDAGGSTRLDRGNLVCTVVEDFYGAILHEDQNFGGSCEVILNNVANLNSTPVIGTDTSSITPFLKGGIKPGGVWLCPDPEARKEDCQGPFQRANIPSVTDSLGPEFDNQISSIIIEGPYLAALFDRENYFGECEVFDRSDPNFLNNPIGRCDCLSGVTGSWGCEDCLSSFKVFPIRE